MPSEQDLTNFVKEFVERGKSTRSDMVPAWEETLENYLVKPPASTALSQDTRSPMYDGRQLTRAGTSQGVYLKDPETHQVIDTYLSKLMIALFGDDHFLAATKRGREDASAATTTTGLLRYVLGLDGHYRSVQTWLLDMLLFGTGIVQNGWKLIERPRTFRDIVGVDSAGNEIREEVRISDYPYYDDCRFMNIDIMDFYPDFGVDNMRDMVGCAKRLDMTGFDAMQKARKGIFDMDAVKAAISAAAEGANPKPDKGWQAQRLQRATRHPGFENFEAYEYYGEVPFKYANGERWRVITIANGQILRDIPWPFDDYRLPFYDATISPINGRFYGLSPAEGARYQQDFLDFLLMQMAQAVSRTVTPPILVNSDAITDPAALAAWRLDVPIRVEDANVNNAVSTLSYNPNLNNAFAFFGSVKNSLRENTGAFGSIQGGGLGINRASATEAETTFRMALDRPEMFARYLERECLPPLGRGVLKLYQQNLETTDELTDRVGEFITGGQPVALADIQGDFDVKFVGSRNHQSLQSRMAFVDRIVQLGAIPQIANLFDWKELAIQILEGGGFHNMAEKIGVPQTVMQNLLVGQLAGNQALGNGNGEVPNVPQADTSLAQQGGGLVPFNNFGA